MYKVAISDLDGTLLGPDHKISIKTKESIHRWIQANRKFVIATGRHFIETQNIRDEISEPIYLISSNGARVHDKDGQIILKHNLPCDIATFISEQYADGEVQMNLFTDHHWYANFALEELDGMRLNQQFKYQITDFQTVDKSNTIKMLFWGEREKLTPIYQHLKEKFSQRLNLTFSLDCCLEIMDINANKGVAVNAVLESKKLTTEQAIAFGDGMNDLEMLQVVGKAVLMENAQPDLINALPRLEMTASSKENGVAMKLDAILNEAKD